jgi:KUP system potassium uptake protein
MVLDVPASPLLNKPLNPITSVLPMLINSYLTVHTGIAVVAVMLVTTVLLTLVIIIVWRKPILVALAFFMVFGTIESIYVSSALYKVRQGGWVPLVIAVAVGSITYVWHYGTLKRFQHEIQNKVPMGWLLGLGPSLGLVRVPGIGLVYTDLAHGVPPIFSHFITNLPAIHSTVVFVNIKYLPVNTVPQEERFLIRRIGPKVYSMYRCAARYGYRDVHKKDDRFEQLLIESLITFIKFEALQGSSAHESLAASYTPDQESVSSMQQPSMQQPIGAMDSPTLPGVLNLQGDKLDTSTLEGSSTIYMPALLNPSQEISSIHSGVVQIPNSQGADTTSRDETAFVLKGKDAGVVYLLGNSVVKARSNSSFVKKLIINYAYSFLRRICRESHVTLNIPHESLLQVGMVYNV